MENFTAYNPTRLRFGKNAIKDLGGIVSKYGKKVLLVYGGGSIKKNGIYDTVIEQLVSAGLSYTEYRGITPNPVIEDVDAAAEKGRVFGADVVLAVGGGSVIDASKIISITIPVNHSGWEFMAGREKPKTALPLIDILTLAATGTEMNRFAVVQNNSTKEKLGYGNPLIYPKESFLDPQYTVSVPKNYTGYGVVDLVAHCLEAYFGEGEATMSDRFVFAIIKEAMTYGPLLIDDLGNYSLREKIMYAATCALNNLTIYGRKSGDWGVHSLGHVLSVLYDVPHGASLSIVYPAWLKLHQDRAADRINHLGKQLFSVDGVEKTIFEMEVLFSSLDGPTRLSDIGIQADKHEEIIQTMEKNAAEGSYHKLSTDDYHRLITYMA